MPRVQRYGERRVDPTPLPGVRGTAAETELSTGAVLSREKAQTALVQGAAVQPLENIGLQILNEQARKNLQAKEEAKRDAEELQRIEWDKQGSDWENKALYDPEKGALTRKGKDAMGVPEDVLSGYDQQTAEMGKSIVDPKQRQAFEAMRLRRRMQLDLQLRRHTFGEMQSYLSDELKGMVDGRVQSAIAKGPSDPAMAREDLQTATDAIRSQGKKLGMGPEEINAEVGRVQTRVHQGIVDSLVAANRIDAAQFYFDEHKDQIGGEARAHIDATLKEGKLRVEEQSAGDTLTAKFPDDLDAQLAAARKQYSGETEERVVRELKDRANERSAAQQVKTEKDMTAAANAIYAAGGKLSAVPAGLYASLSPSHRMVLDNYADSLKPKATKIATNPQRYYQLSQWASSPDPALNKAFMDADLSQDLTKLDEGDWKKFVDIQAKMRQGDPSQGKKLLVSETQQNRMVDEALLTVGLDPSPPQPGTKTFDQDKSDRVSAFRRRVRDEVRLLEARTKEPATDEQVQDIVDILRRPTTQGEGSLFRRGQQFYAFETQPQDASKPTLATDVKEIPVQDLQQIHEALRAQHIDIADSAVLTYYNLMQRAKGAKEPLKPGDPGTMTIPGTNRTVVTPPGGFGGPNAKIGNAPGKGGGY